MQDNMSIIEQAEKSLTANGKQLTAKRKLILSALVDSKKELSAYEIVDYCKEFYSENIKPMSVYRILEFLEEEHLVHKLNVSSKYIACSHITCEHEHGVAQFLICSSCGKVSELTTEAAVITGLQAHARKQGFTVTSPQLEINCVCDECAK